MSDNKQQGGTPHGKLDWRRTDYGRLAFPDSCNFFAAITSIFKATKTKSSASGLQFWWDGLVAKLGLAEAEAEKERVFARGRRIDDTAAMLIEGYKGYKSVCQNMHSSDVSPVYYCKRYLSAFPPAYDWRVLYYLATNRIELIANEIPVWSRSRKQKGYLDALTVQDGILYVTDFKGTTNPKKVDGTNLAEPAQQVSFYRSCLVEMYTDAMDGKDEEAAELFAQIPGLTPSLVENSRAVLLYFQDGKDEAIPFVLMTDEDRKAGICEAEAEKFKDDNCVRMTYEMMLEQIHDETVLRKLPSWKTEYKFLSIDWRMEQLARRMKKYDSYPVVFLDAGEQGFWRRQWKRTPPENVLSADAFDVLLAKETDRLENPDKYENKAKINFKTFYKFQNVL